MNDSARQATTRDIVVEEELPHAPETVWEVLTRSDLIDRWLMANDFQPTLGRHFTFKAKPIGDWNGIVDCEVLEIDPPFRLVYSWKGGSVKNPGYGGAIDSIVTWTLTPVKGGTLLKLVHSGFRSPENDSAYENMGSGWRRIVVRIGELVGEVA